MKSTQNFGPETLLTPLYFITFQRSHRCVYYYYHRHGDGRKFHSHQRWIAVYLVFGGSFLVCRYVETYAQPGTASFTAFIIDSCSSTNHFFFCLLVSRGWEQDIIKVGKSYGMSAMELNLNEYNRGDDEVGIVTLIAFMIK